MQIFKYFLRYMNTKKALSRWTVFYVGSSDYKGCLLTKSRMMLKREAI